MTLRNKNFVGLFHRSQTTEDAPHRLSGDRQRHGYRLADSMCSQLSPVKIAKRAAAYRLFSGGWKKRLDIDKLITHNNVHLQLQRIHRDPSSKVWIADQPNIVGFFEGDAVRGVRWT